VQVDSEKWAKSRSSRLEKDKEELEIEIERLKQQATEQENQWKWTQQHVESLASDIDATTDYLTGVRLPFSFPSFLWCLLDPGWSWTWSYQVPQLVGPRAGIAFQILGTSIPQATWK
jgi:hypothetical protein